MGGTFFSCEARICCPGLDLMKYQDPVELLRYQLPERTSSYRKGHCKGHRTAPHLWSHSQSFCVKTGGETCGNAGLVRRSLLVPSALLQMGWP